VEETEKMRELVGLVFGASRRGGLIQSCKKSVTTDSMT
jgi:hypothetical protein